MDGIHYDQKYQRWYRQRREGSEWRVEWIDTPNPHNRHGSLQSLPQQHSNTGNNSTSAQSQYAIIPQQHQPQQHQPQQHQPQQHEPQQHEPQQHQSQQLAQYQQQQPYAQNRQTQNSQSQHPQYGAHQLGQHHHSSQPPLHYSAQYGLATGAANAASVPAQVSTKVPNFGQGQMVTGTYDSHAKNSMKHERLDPAYHIQTGDFFVVGRLLSILFTENAGNMNPTAYNTSPSYAVVKYGEYAHTQIRRFLVVKVCIEHFYGVPVFTYGGRATLKPGVRPEQHSVIYTLGQTPELLPGETGITKASIPVVPAPNTPPLSKDSRVYYGIHHPIQRNVKMKNLGTVPREWIPIMLQHWAAENGNPNQQSMDVADD